MHPGIYRDAVTAVLANIGWSSEMYGYVLTDQARFPGGTPSVQQIDQVKTQLEVSAGCSETSTIDVHNLLLICRHLVAAINNTTFFMYGQMLHWYCIDILLVVH